MHLSTTCTRVGSIHSIINSTASSCCCSLRLWLAVLLGVTIGVLGSIILLDKGCIEQTEQPSSLFVKTAQGEPSVKKEVTASSSSHRIHDYSVASTFNNDNTTGGAIICQDFTFYPQPQPESGLPYLADVFATHDLESIVFIGINRGVCGGPAWQDVDDNNNFEGHRFVCSFQNKVADNASSSYIDVISEPVPPTGFPQNNNGISNFLFWCQIPKEYKHFIFANSTSITMDLHSIMDPTSRKIGMRHEPHYQSQSIHETPKISNIPICRSSSSTHNKKKKYNLVAYTRVLAVGNNYTSNLYRIPEWIDYHLMQGFDHFIIYDHDPSDSPQEHRPLEVFLANYIEAGIVTYRWWPLKDCFLDKDGQLKGKQLRIGQAAGGLAAMHRLGKDDANYLAHMDIDEFFVVYNNNNNDDNDNGNNDNPTKKTKTVLEFVQEILGSPGDDSKEDDNKKKHSYYDAMKFKPTVLDFCNGTIVTAPQEDSNLAKRQCLTKSHYFDVKLIMRMDKIMHYQVHTAVVTWDWELPRVYPVQSGWEGFLAHLKGHGPGDDMEPGIKITQYNNDPANQRVSYFDTFLEEREQEGKDEYYRKYVVLPPPQENNP